MKKQPYSRGNIFVGKYNIPKDGWIKLKNPKVKYLLQTPSGYAFVESTELSRKAYPDAQLFLIVEDGDFWPVMIQVDQPV